MQAEELFQRRVIDQVKAAYTRNYVVFTDFFDLNELNILHSMPASSFSGVNVFLSGGCTNAERQMAAFVPDAFSYEIKSEADLSFPIAVLQIKPVNGKFAEALSHRDYLGSVMSLGIERRVLGDLLIFPDRAVLFARENMADYLCEHLGSVRHTPVETVRLFSWTEEELQPDTEEITGSAASLRLDVLIGLGFRLSRSRAQEAIETGKVFVNSRQILSGSHILKEKDRITLRGKGKLIFDEVLSSTKKGRQIVRLLLYK